MKTLFTLLLISTTSYAIDHTIVCSDLSRYLGKNIQDLEYQRLQLNRRCRLEQQQQQPQHQQGYVHLTYCQFEKMQLDLQLESIRKSNQLVEQTCQQAMQPQQPQQPQSCTQH